MEYKQRVWCNNHGIRLALKEGCVPMQHNIDQDAKVPYFINLLRDGRFDNYHHVSYSAAHVPGRWLNALLTAANDYQVAVDEEAVQVLTDCTYWIFDEKAGLPLCLNLDKMRPDVVADLHNLREYMHALYALIRFRADDRAYENAIKMMRTVDQYFDYERNTWRKKDFEHDYGIRTYTAPIKEYDKKDYYFPSSFGRYIEPLVKLYVFCGIKEALDQAVNLAECAFRHTLTGDNWYTPDNLGAHAHSITSLFSSLALLSKHTDDAKAMKAAENFLKIAENDMFLDFGFCIENLFSKGYSGEINNTSDLVRTYLLLGEKVDKAYYHKAEKMLRGHFLPAQLLDDDLFSVSVSGDGNPYDRGTFGFPGPYGHEIEPGRLICYNWDIVGGAVDGLCEVLKHITAEHGDTVEINMLFGCDTGEIKITDPYINNNILSISNYSGKNKIVKLWLPASVSVEKITGVLPEDYTLSDNSLILTDTSREIKVALRMEKAIKNYSIRENSVRMEFTGDMITAAGPGDGRMRFFKNIE